MLYLLAWFDSLDIDLCYPATVDLLKDLECRLVVCLNLLFISDFEGHHLHSFCIANWFLWLFGSMDGLSEARLGARDGQRSCHWVLHCLFIVQVSWYSTSTDRILYKRETHTGEERRIGNVDSCSLRELIAKSNGEHWAFITRDIFANIE